MANAQAFQMGWQAADDRFAHRRARKEQFEDEARQFHVADLTNRRDTLSKLAGLLPKDHPKLPEIQQGLKDIEAQLQDIYNPLPGPGLMEKSKKLINWATRKKQPAAAPVLSATSTPGQAATEASKINFPMQDQEVTLPNGKKFLVPYSISAHEETVEPAPAVPVQTSVAIKEPVLTPQQRQRMARRAEAGQRAEQDVTGAGALTPEMEAQRKIDWIMSLPPEKQAVAERLLGIKITPKLINIRNKDTGQESMWDTTEGLPPEGWVQTGTSGGMARSLGFGLSTTDAITAMQSGQKFEKPDGTFYTAEELAQFPSSMQLRAYSSGGNTYYGLADQNVHTVTLGNIRYPMDQFGNVDTSRPLGEARVGTTRQMPGMAPGETVSLTSGPLTTGAAGAPARPMPTRAAPAVVPTAGAAPVAAPSAGVPKGRATTPPKLPAAPKPSVGPPPSPFVKGTMLAQGRSVAPVISSMSVVGAQVFGDPELKTPPIWEYAHMYDDPDLGRALNKALTMNSLTQPYVHSEPGLWDTVAVAAGVAGWSQEQINQAAVDARNEVQRLGGPDAMSFLSRIMGLQEDLSALRTATRASAAAGSIQNLTRAAPIYNVANGQDFRNQLAVTMGTAVSSMAGYPVINPAYVDWWRRGAMQARTPDAQQQVKVRQSRSTGQYQHSTDGGATWIPGLPPKQ